MNKSAFLFGAIAILLVIFSIYSIVDKNKRGEEIQSFHQSKFDHAIGSLKDALRELQQNNLNDAEINLRVSEEDIRLLGDDFNYDRSKTHVSTLPMSHLFGLYAQEIHALKAGDTTQNQVAIMSSDLQSIIQTAEKESWARMNFDSFQSHWKQAVSKLKDRQVLNVYEKN